MNFLREIVGEFRSRQMLARGLLNVQTFKPHRRLTKTTTSIVAMRISLIHTTLVLLTVLHSVSALPGFLDGWFSFLGFAKDTEKNVEHFAKVVGVKAVEFKKEASHTVVGFANVVGEEVARLAGVVVHDVDAVANKTIVEFKESITDVVFKVQAMEYDMHDDLEEHGVSSDRIFDMFSAQMASMFEDLKAEFHEPLPELQTAAYKDRAVIVGRFLDMVEDEFVTVSALWHMSESDARKSFATIKPAFSSVILITVNLIINHPDLFISIALLLIPENWFLGPLLRIFGFGPLGPVKGSAAAWLQGQLWGGAIKEGSWFAILQSAGMKMAL